GREPRALRPAAGTGRPRPDRAGGGAAGARGRPGGTLRAGGHPRPQHPPRRGRRGGGDARAARVAAPGARQALRPRLRPGAGRQARAVARRTGAPSRGTLRALGFKRIAYLRALRSRAAPPSLLIRRPRPPLRATRAPSVTSRPVLQI